MAGIVGFIGEHIIDKEPNLIVSMVKAIQYVNSDLIDQWNDKYLSISRIHHGVVNPEEQPIFNEDKSLMIIMEGEIYGYEADKNVLLDKGHSFTYEQNDAEFCLHLYEEQGEQSFLNLNGSFLIAIYNLRTKQLIVVNDRFSSRPLFYYGSSGKFIFGSQLKAVLKSEQVPRNLDSQAIMEFFTFQRVLGNKTYYKDIKVMFPALILKVQQGRLGFKQYWELNYREDKRKSKLYYIDAFKNAVSNAVKRRVNDNNRYGILLSGGLDSRTVLSASYNSMTTFTIADFENREVEIARKISNEVGCKHIFIKRDPDHYANILEKAVDIGDGMYRFDHAHFIGFFDQIKDECGILLHGCALGALFQGPYLPRKEFHFLDKIIYLPVLEYLSEKTLPQAILSKLMYSLWDKKPNRIFAADFLENYKDTIENSLNSTIQESKNHAKNLYNRFDYFIFSFFFKHVTFLNELCIRPYVDERMVVCDNDLFDLYLEMPPELRFNGKIIKSALKKLNLKIARIQNANTGVSPVVPEYLEFGIGIAQKIINKIRPHKLPHPSDSQGSWPKRSELIRHNDKLKKLIWDVIYDEKFINPKIFTRSTFVNMYNRHLNYQEDFTWFFYLMLTFGVWHKRYGP